MSIRLLGSFTERAKAAASALGDERAMVFCLVNSILDARDDRRTIEYIRAWANLKNDVKLLRSLNLALRIALEERLDDCAPADARE